VPQARLSGFFDQGQDRRSLTRLRHGCRAGSLERVPLDVDWRDDIAFDGDLALPYAERAPLWHPVWDEFHKRPPVLGDHDGIAGVGYLIDQGQALGFELGGLDGAKHGQIHMTDHDYGHIASFDKMESRRLAGSKATLYGVVLQKFPMSPLLPRSGNVAARPETSRRAASRGLRQ